MPISKRTLMKWRKEALKFKQDIKGLEQERIHEPLSEVLDCILLLTQELLDQALLKEK